MRKYYITVSYSRFPSVSRDETLRFRHGAMPWLFDDAPMPVKTEFWGGDTLHVEHAFPVSEAWMECYYRNGDVNGRQIWRKPMRKRADGQWMPNRHQRKHGCYALDEKGVN